MAQVPPGQRPEAVDIAYTPSCSRGRGRERRKGGGNKRTGGAAREEARRPPHKAFPRRNALSEHHSSQRHDAPQAGAGFLACEDGGRCFPRPFKPSRMGVASVLLGMTVPVVEISNLEASLDGISGCGWKGAARWAHVTCHRIVEPNVPPGV